MIQFTELKAADLEWSGLYRFEANHIESSELAGEAYKDYGLHHFVLKPKIIAADGLNIYGRFDILNSQIATPNQMGETWGQGSTAASTNNTDSNAFGDSQMPATLQITNLYLAYIQEFGSIIIGRAPLQFGLGMSHSAGDGQFDHWYDNRNMVGYKMVFGNSYFMPSISKVNENTINNNSLDVTDVSFQFQHNNPDANLEMGVFYQMRKSSNGNDAPVSNTGEGYYGGVTGLLADKLDVNHLNLYAIRDRANFKWGIELSFDGGKVGVRDGGGIGSNVALAGFGFATEFEFRPQGKVVYGVKAGYASGDDPTTTNKYEGFAFDRNYDVALLLFNHQLGQVDIINSKINGGGATADNDSMDIESVGNAAYFAPSVLYKWKEDWNLKGTLIAGFLNNDILTTTPTQVTIDKSLGYEFDLELQFKPTENFTWLNQLAYFTPGTAFEAGQGLDTKSALALFSKVAISF